MPKKSSRTKTAPTPTDLKTTHLSILLQENWQIADTMDTTDTDTIFANMVAPMTVCYIQLDISYIMHKSMILLYCLSDVVCLTAGLCSEYVHRHSVGLLNCI